jgi:hypothetical protein
VPESSVPAAPAAAPNHGADITPENPVVVLGGGPAGLTAAYQLAKAGKPVIVLESTDMLGGIARTEVRDGYRFDLGGHRFFTKVKEVDDLWHEIMEEEFLKRPRQSRIYWNDKFLEYPLQGVDVIKKLGPLELTRCGLSYLWSAVKPKGREDTFEDWVSNRFGKRRSCGASPRMRSGPSGPRSGSRACPSSAPPRPPSSATPATLNR